jgi:glycosyltransferase involved in cell wall biosynthesis
VNRSNSIVLHDSFAFKGGGERLVHILCEGLDLDLAFGERSDQGFDLDALPGRLIDLKTCSHLWGWRTVQRFYSFTLKTRFLKSYESVIYSGQNSPIAVHNHPGGKNIYYCHTPPRSLYDLKDYRLASLSFLQRLNHRAFNLCFQPLFESAINKMDIIIANSVNIQKRIKKYLQKDSVVIHPPCDTESFHWKGQDDYYFSFARLDSLKRVDVVVKAFIQMPDKRLVIASTGPEMERLKQLAEGSENITFTGAVDDRQLKGLLEKSIASIYIPREEDFGMSPVESLAAGKPVLGVAEGGVLETLVHGETGILIPANPSPEDLITAVHELNPKRALGMRELCEQRARTFDTKIFLEKMSPLLER